MTTKHTYKQQNFNIMTKVISISNNKGGVGKTTTTINLAAALHKFGLRVLIIDIDGQANLSESVGLNLQGKNTIYNALRGDCELPVYDSEIGIDIVPANEDLPTINNQLINEPGRELILTDLIKKVKNKYDFILIDCGPEITLLTINALTASNSVIIPVQAEYFAMRSMAKLFKIIQKVRLRMNKKLKIEGILITQYDNHKRLNKGVSEQIRESTNEKVFDTHIRNNIYLAESQSYGMDIFSYKPEAIGAKDYECFAKEIFPSDMEISKPKSRKVVK